MADPVEEQTLHMVNADPNRTPTFTQFANPDYFIGTSPVKCPDAAHAVADCVDYHFAWSHGDATEDIGRTWAGFVGPGVEELGQTSRVWSDHTDLRPTMLSLLGLRDSYTPDGRVLAEILDRWAVPRDMRHHGEDVIEMAELYKQITAPFGQFAKNTLAASTRAVGSGSSTDDATYAATEDRIAALTAQRNDVAGHMREVLEDVAFGGDRPSKHELDSLARHARSLLRASSTLASG
jgi:hypothetical protein